MIYKLRIISRDCLVTRWRSWLPLWIAPCLLVASQTLPQQNLPKHEVASLLAHDPEQSDTRSGPLRYGNRYLTPRAHFRVAARVLGHERYYLDPDSAISPVDLLLGWGPMSNPAFLRQYDLRFAQYDRFGYVGYGAPSPPPDQTLNSLTNAHLIAATPAVRDYLLRRVKPGDLIYLEGELVDVLALDTGDLWPTSLTRDDEGAGACEVLLVRQVAHLR